MLRGYQTQKQNSFVSIKTCILCRLVASLIWKTSLIYGRTRTASLDQPEGTLVGYGVKFVPLHASILGTSLRWTWDCPRTTASNQSTAPRVPAHQLSHNHWPRPQQQASAIASWRLTHFSWSLEHYAYKVNCNNSVSWRVSAENSGVRLCISKYAKEIRFSVTTCVWIPWFLRALGKSHKKRTPGRIHKVSDSEQTHRGFSVWGLHYLRSIRFLAYVI